MEERLVKAKSTSMMLKLLRAGPGPEDMCYKAFGHGAHLGRQGASKW
jgi:hypothetical protein